MSQTQLQKLEAIALGIILAKMGFNQTLPYVVRYAPCIRGDVGLPSLTCLQGVEKVLYILKSFHHHNSLSQAMITALDWLNMTSRLTGNIIQCSNMASIEYTNSAWGNAVHRYLVSNNCTV